MSCSDSTAILDLLELGGEIHIVPEKDGLIKVAACHGYIKHVKTIDPMDFSTEVEQIILESEIRKCASQLLRLVSPKPPHHTDNEFEQNVKNHNYWDHRERLGSDGDALR